MSARAYVLIESAVGRAGEVVAALKKIPGVTAVDTVTGPYDVILRIECDNLNDVGDVVTGQVHPIPGIIRTVTCLIVGS
ncbi:Lrp/AsnC family transcriptional regulator [Chloroflexota bacterium]